MFPQANYLTSLSLSFFFCKKETKRGKSLAVQQLGLGTFTAVARGSIPQAVQHGQKTERETKRNISQATAVDYQSYLINAHNKGRLLTVIYLFI